MGEVPNLEEKIGRLEFIHFRGYPVKKMVADARRKIRFYDAYKKVT